MYTGDYLVRFDAYDACVVLGCLSDICHEMPHSKLEHYDGDTPVLEMERINQ